jgi:salicylate hydroxylase
LTQGRNSVIICLIANLSSVIGCDGIKSHVRRLLVGDEDPQSRPSYTHKYAYRGLVPMEKAIAAIGEELATNRIMHMGKDGHILTFPVSHGRTMNVVAFHHESKDWESDKLVVPTTRAEAKRDFGEWGQNVKAIIDLLPDNLDKWGIFDLGDHPLSYFNKGRICVAGDAAHATGPHHGAGAGFCIEDSAVLSELLYVAWINLQGRKARKSKAEVLEDVLMVFDRTRRERTQWLVQSSRISADLYEWRDELCGRDPVKIKQELLWRNHKIWKVDIEEITRLSNMELERMII